VTETIGPARTQDLEELLGLLRAADLPEAGVSDHFPDGFILARDADGTLSGAAGLERYADCALLRSVVVRPDLRGTGLGQRLSSAVLERADSNGIGEVYLLTTTAERFFPRLGFEQVDRSALPEALSSSAELQGACPASAVAMRRARP
jgi:amino-acid N-acetyltransferase